MKPRKFEITILDALGRYIFKEEEQGWDERDVLEKVLAKKSITSFTTIKIYPA